jgi:hypothetical protein
LIPELFDRNLLNFCRQERFHVLCKVVEDVHMLSILRN